MFQILYLKYIAVLILIIFSTFADECRKDVAQVIKEKRVCPNSCSAIRPCRNIKAECVCDEPCGFVCLQPGLRCPELKEPEHGFIEHLGDKKFRSIAIYECFVGYQLVGPDLRKCQSDGSWSGKEPFCIDDDIFCVQPDFHVPNAKFEPVKDEYDLGTEVTFKCETTLNILSSSTTKCEYKDGAAVWTPINLRCLEIQCDPPEEPENGRIIKQTGNKLHDTVQYECNEFTSTTDKMVSTCELKGDEVKWSEKPPQCLKFCDISHLPSELTLFFLNGKHILPKRQKHIEHGNSVTIICRSQNHDVYIKGKSSSFIHCSDGNLSGVEIECRPYVECSHLISPINGFVITDEELRPKSVAKYECKDGYELIGPQNRTCQSDGNWTGIQPFCALKGIRCSKPDFDPLNAEIVSLPIRNNYFVGDEVIYRCKSGFKSGDNDVTTTKCHERNDKGIWFPWIRMNCQSSRCSDPEKIRNGFIEGDDYSFGKGISYQCNDGYKIKGFPFRICLFQGHWSGSSPTCEAVFCANPKLTIENGRVFFDKPLKYGSIVRYECNDGYLLIGDKQRHCLKDGQTNSSEPKCKEIECEEADKPEFGTIIKQSGTKWNNTVEYACNAHLTLLGSNIVICERNSKWSQKPPKCLHDCQVVQNANSYGTYNNRRLRNGDYIKHGETIDLHCELPSSIKNPLQNKSLTSTCDNGLWSANISCLPTPGKIVENCIYDAEDQFLLAFNEKKGLIKEKTSFELSEQIIFRCIDIGHYILDGSNLITCTQNGWDKDLPTCKRLSYRSSFKPPTITFDVNDDHVVEPNGTLIVTEDASVRFSCWWFKTRGQPTWQLNNRDIIDSEDLIIEWVENNSKFNLIIKKFSQNDNGKYSCITPYGKKHSIDVRIKPSKKTTVESISTTVTTTSSRPEPITFKEIPSTWAPQTHSVCEAGDPSNLDIFENGNPMATPQKTFNHESILRFRCSDSYKFKLVGNHMTICQNGIWSEGWPSCNQTDKFDWYGSPPIRVYSRTSPKKLENGELLFSKNHVIHLACEFFSREPHLLLNDRDITDTFPKLTTGFTSRHGYYVILGPYYEARSFKFQCLVPHKPPNMAYSNSIVVRFGSNCEINNEAVYRKWKAEIEPKTIRYPTYAEGDKVYLKCTNGSKGRRIPRFIICSDTVAVWENSNEFFTC